MKTNMARMVGAVALLAAMMSSGLGGCGVSDPEPGDDLAGCVIETDENGDEYAACGDENLGTYEGAVCPASPPGFDSGGPNSDCETCKDKVKDSSIAMLNYACAATTGPGAWGGEGGCCVSNSVSGCDGGCQGVRIDASNALYSCNQHSGGPCVKPCDDCKNDCKRKGTSVPDGVKQTKECQDYCEQSSACAQ